MKKALALVLALVLALSLGVTAFAAVSPSIDLEIDLSQDKVNNTVTISGGVTVDVVAGGSFTYGWVANVAKIDLAALTYTDTKGVAQQPFANYIATYNTKGADYKITYIGGTEFGSAKVNDDNDLLVTATSKALVEKGTLRFVVQGVKSVINGTTGKTDIIKTIPVYFELDIHPDWIGGSVSGDNVAVDMPVQLYIDEFVISADQFAALAKTTLEVRALEDEFALTTKVAKGQGAFNFKYNTDVAEAVADANEDAHIRAINFIGNQTFKNAAKITLSNAVGGWLSLGDIINHTGDETVYIYTYADGKLTLVEKQDASKGNVVYTAPAGKALGSIYFSDKELKGAASSNTSSSSSGTKGNVNTGANDMVSVAVAMAVVSLAAAGAVAFKKASK